MDGSVATANSNTSSDSNTELKTGIEDVADCSLAHHSELPIQSTENADDGFIQPPGQGDKPSYVQADQQKVPEEPNSLTAPLESEEMDLQFSDTFESAVGASELRAPTAFESAKVETSLNLPLCSKENPVDPPTLTRSSSAMSEETTQSGLFPSLTSLPNINNLKSSSFDFKSKSDSKNSTVKDQDFFVFGRPLTDKSPNSQYSNVLKSPSDPTGTRDISSQNNNTGKTLSTVLNISQSFVNANKSSVTAASLPTTQVKKSFAQIVTPKIVADSIPTRGSTPDCGLLMERVRNSTLDDYARAIEVIVGKGKLVFLGQSPQDQEKVLAFVESPGLVEKLVSSGMAIKGKWLCISYLHQPATRLIISDVMPFVTDEIILKACSIFGQPVHEQLRRIPSSVRAREFKHVLSYRRELLIVLDKDKQVPNHVVVFSHNNFYRLGVTTPGLTCYNCNQQGHRAVFCKKPRQQAGEDKVEQFGDRAPIQKNDSATYSAMVKHQMQGLIYMQENNHSNLAQTGRLQEKSGCERANWRFSI